MGFVSSLQSALGSKADQSISVCYLVDIVPADGSINVHNRLAFQYFPESIHDSYSTEWAQKNIIGGSHPIYQWMHGNARTISFEAVFTADVDPLPVPGSSSLLGGISNAVNDAGALASAVSANPLGTAISALKSAAGGNLQATNPAGGIAWLRSKLYPTYANGVSTPPKPMFLFLPNSAITSGVSASTTGSTTQTTPNSLSPPNIGTAAMSTSPAGGTSSPDGLPVLMLSCNVTYESFFRSGSPRVVTVALEFVETIQISTQNWNYVDQSKITSVYTATTPPGRFYNYDPKRIS